MRNHLSEDGCSVYQAHHRSGSMSRMRVNVPVSFFWYQKMSISSHWSMFEHLKETAWPSLRLHDTWSWARSAAMATAAVGTRAQGWAWCSGRTERVVCWAVIGGELSPKHSQLQAALENGIMVVWRRSCREGALPRRAGWTQGASKRSSTPAHRPPGVDWEGCFWVTAEPMAWCPCVSHGSEAEDQ